MEPPAINPRLDQKGKFEIPIKFFHYWILTGYLRSFAA